MDELMQALNSVADKYDDFLVGMRSILKNDEENRRKVIDYIKEDASRTTSDVIEYLDVLGI